MEMYGNGRLTKLAITAHQIDPTGGESGWNRVFRGGSWNQSESALRSANRADRGGGDSQNNIGFRVGFHQVPNNPPTDLNSTAELTISENEPIGAIIGEFNATDPEGGALTYEFLNAEFNLADSLLAYYPLDGDAKDHGKYRNDGTIIGSLNWEPGMVGQSMVGSINNYIEIPHSESITLGAEAGKDWTFSLWIKSLSSSVGSTWRNFIGKRGSNSAETDYALATESGRFYWGTGSATDAVAWMKIDEPDILVWHHVAALISQNSSSSGTKSLYIDGSLVAPGNYSAKASSNANVLLGRINSLLMR